MRKFNRILVYNEPGPNGEDLTIEITEEDAIQQMVQAAYAKRGDTWTYEQHFGEGWEEKALADFMAVHWAWYKEN